MLADLRRRGLWWALAIGGSLVLVGFNARGLGAAPAFGLPPEFIGVGNDLAVYLRAGLDVAEGRSPYPAGPWGTTAVYHYSPFVALLLTPLFRDGEAALPFRALAEFYLGAIVMLLLVAWWLWRAVFRAARWPEAAEAMTVLAPAWLVYSQWFADQTYLNIYTLLLALTGALAWAVLRGRLWLSVLLAVLIAQAKPHYLFPLLIPLLLGRWRFFFAIGTAALAGYALTVALTIASLGVERGTDVYLDYLTFLGTIPDRFPWVAYQLAYNNSWRALLTRCFGLQWWIQPAVNALRLATLLPLAMVLWSWARTLTAMDVRAAIGAALALHLFALLSLDQLWEATILIVIWPTLSVSPVQRLRLVASSVMIPFVLLGFVQLAGRLWLGGDLTAEWPVIVLPTLALYGLSVHALRRTLALPRA